MVPLLLDRSEVGARLRRPRAPVSGDDHAGRRVARPARRRRDRGAGRGRRQRGGFPGRRRASRTWARDVAPRAPLRRSQGQGHPAVPGRGPGGQPPHAGGLRRCRLPGPAPARGRRPGRRAGDLGRCRGPGRGRRTRVRIRDQVVGTDVGAEGSGGVRRTARRHGHRRRGPDRDPRRRLRRIRRRGAPVTGGAGRGAVVRVVGRRGGAGRPRGDRRARRAGGRCAHRCRRCWRRGCGDHLLRLRGDGGARRRSAAAAVGRGPRSRRARGRPQLPRSRLQRPCREPQRHVRRSGPPARGSCRREPVGRCRDRAHGPRRADRRGCPVLRVPGQQGRRLQQRPAGRVVRRPRSDLWRALPRVVRQRPQVRALRPALRRAQASRRRRGWQVRGWPQGRGFTHCRRGLVGRGRPRAVRTSRRHRVLRCRGAGRDHAAADS